MAEDLARLLADIRACRLCVDAPVGRPLPHEPRPVVVAGAGARIAICGQAPGTRVHASGRPFTDASGVRLREWMAVSEAEFYDAQRIAIVPMGFCFPGNDAKGGDLPPRRECAPAWRARLFAGLPDLELVLLVGQHALRWHLEGHGKRSLDDTVSGWRQVWERPVKPRQIPLPHPSWRNNAWITRNPWFAEQLLPVLRREIRRILAT